MIAQTVSICNEKCPPAQAGGQGDLQEDILQNEQRSQHIHQGLDGLALACGNVQQHIADDAQGNALGDGVEQGHGDDGQVCGDGLGQVVQLEADLGNGAHHQEADHDQGGGGGEAGDGGEDGGEQGGGQEQQTGGQGGQTGAAAGGDTGGGLDEGGDGGGAQHGAHGGADGISQQSGLDAGQLALLVDHVGLGGNADQGAQGVEQVNKQERAHDDDEVGDADGGEIHLEALAEGLAQLGKIGQTPGGEQGEIADVVGDIDACNLAEHADDPGGQDAQQDGAVDILDVQHGGDEQTDESQQGTDAGGVEVVGEAGDGHQGGGVHAQAGVLQADEGDEQADAHAHAPLQVQGDGVEDGLTDIGHGQDDEQDALKEDGQQGDLPAVAEAQDNGVGQEGVQTHAGGQGEGQVGHEGHAGGADEGGDGGCQQHGGGIHTGVTQNAGVDGQDVGHGHEGGNAGHDLGLHRGAVGGELEAFFKHFSFSFRMSFRFATTGFIIAF